MLWNIVAEAKALARAYTKESQMTGIQMLTHPKFRELLVTPLAFLSWTMEWIDGVQHHREAVAQPLLQAVATDCACTVGEVRYALREERNVNPLYYAQETFNRAFVNVKTTGQLLDQLPDDDSRVEALNKQEAEQWHIVRMAEIDLNVQLELLEVAKAL